MILCFFRATISLVFLLQSCNGRPPQNIDPKQKKLLTYINKIQGIKKLLTSSGVTLYNRVLFLSGIVAYPA